MRVRRVDRVREGRREEKDEKLFIQFDIGKKINQALADFHSFAGSSVSRLDQVFRLWTSYNHNHATFRSLDWIFRLCRTNTRA